MNRGGLSGSKSAIRGAYARDSSNTVNIKSKEAASHGLSHGALCSCTACLGVQEGTMTSIDELNRRIIIVSSNAID